jgi:hypothetical protein
MRATAFLAGLQAVGWTTQCRSILRLSKPCRSDRRRQIKDQERTLGGLRSMSGFKGLTSYLSQDGVIGGLRPG